MPCLSGFDFFARPIGIRCSDGFMVGFQLFQMRVNCADSFEGDVDFNIEDALSGAYILESSKRLPGPGTLTSLLNRRSCLLWQR